MAEKEIRMMVRIRNNRLLVAREKVGMSQKDASKAIGIPQTQLMDYEKMKRRPVTDTGEWKDCALKICIFYKEQPDYLWTDTVMSVHSSDAVMKFGAADMPTLEAVQHKQLEAAMGREQLEQMVEALDSKGKKIIQLRFGFGCEVHTLKEVGYVLGGLSTERTRQLEGRALSQLRGMFEHLAKQDKFLASEWRAQRAVDELKWKEEREKRLAVYEATQEELRQARAEKLKLEEQEAKEHAEGLLVLDEKLRKLRKRRRQASKVKTNNLVHDAAVLSRRTRAMEMSLETGEGYLTCLLRCMREDQAKEKR